MPEPRMVIHNIWPSSRVTNQLSGEVKITPIMPEAKREFKNVPQRYRVPVRGDDSIPDEAWEHIVKYWIPLSEGVTQSECLDYCYYKHIRFHYLNSNQNWVKRNVWKVTLDKAMPSISEDAGEENFRGINFGQNLMGALKGRYESGKEYDCKEFHDFLNSYFGVTVDVIFGRSYKGRYFKEVRILYNMYMTIPLDFNANATNGKELGRYEDGDRFLFEDIYTRTDVGHLFGSDGGARKYTIVFVSSEVAPYSMSGSRGDFCGSLPISLAKLGHRVMVVSPRYGDYCDERYASALHTECQLSVPFSGRLYEVSLFREFRDGVDWVFVDSPIYHRPLPPGEFVDDFIDNQLSSTLLCHAACEAPLVLSLRGVTFGDRCLFFAIDHNAGLVPMLLEAKYRPEGMYKDARTILVIHNLALQGTGPASNYSIWGLPLEYYGSVQWKPPGIYPPGTKEDSVNVLKGAMLTSDLISTVSWGYASEILTAEGGNGLHEVLCSRYVTGVTSGIDATGWDPSTDEHITSHYSIENLSGKVVCKRALQNELGLPCRPDCPLIGFVGRLDTQKGVDILLPAIPELLQDDIQFVMLGSGEREYEEWMRDTQSSFPYKFRGQVVLGFGEEEHKEWIAGAEPSEERLRGRVGFSSPITHRIIAGCDILVMPSRVEPCGSSSLYAMRYGTVPVVHAIGGFKDTVQNYFSIGFEDSEEGTGWAFSPLTIQSMIQALTTALTVYRGRDNTESWYRLMKRGMKRNSSWDYTAQSYETLLAKVAGCH